jgi:hypothetical protein
MNNPSAGWEVDPADYPASAGAADKLRFLLRYAILAPSGHNTQPWLFRIRGDRLDLIADRTRALPVVDPHDRALVISCGAALAMLRAAMRRFGHGGEISLLPRSDEPDLLATVGLGAERKADEKDRRLFDAITRRRTTRLPFDAVPLDEDLAADLQSLAGRNGAEATILTDPERKREMAALIAEGDRIQFADPRFRRELAMWVHSRRAASRDGISGANFGMPDALSFAGGLVIRTFDMGKGVGAKDEEIAARSPALLLVSTASDAPLDWLNAGMAHAEMLLAITAFGWTAAYLNQPVEVEALRPRLAALAGTEGYPQLLMRIGPGPEIPPAVRRPVEEVLLG